MNGDASRHISSKDSEGNDNLPGFSVAAETEMDSIARGDNAPEIDDSRGDVPLSGLVWRNRGCNRRDEEEIVGIRAGPAFG
jgi:hypothetical protein